MSFNVQNWNHKEENTDECLYNLAAGNVFQIGLQIQKP